MKRREHSPFRPGGNSGKVETFLRARERYCVGACFRYLAGEKSCRHWYTENGFLLHTRRSLFPVFDFAEEAYRRPLVLPRRLEKTAEEEGIHASQGLVRDIELLRAALLKNGVTLSETIEYDLMELNGSDGKLPCCGERVAPGLSRLLLRVPGKEDMDRLLPLQAGYEQEEVLPQAAAFSPAACRKGLEALVRAGYVLAAEQDGRFVGKININAVSFTRIQIGGVYVDPAYRRQGIAGALVAAFVRRLSSTGKGFTLFVKKQNAAACRVYDRAGFTKLDDYRIDYFL
ncbi:MAG: GNAT family N-acetyltransferase [Treponema sp.]|jgi:ribosomal protein S18 acetylase RimI-like enzyme|nr:GNAT family N-acetyltransferase [Treponema sp.]